MKPSRYESWRLKATALFCFVCAAGFAHSSSPEYLQRVWQAEDGLLNPVPRAVVQSDDGYLWLATDGGLVRFDGVRFTEFEQRIPGEAQARWVVDVIQVSDGSIWASSVNGGIICLNDGKIVRYTEANGLPDNQVMSLHEDREGTIWIGSPKGLTGFRDGQFHTHDLQSIRAIAEDRDGNLWLGTPIGLTRMREGRFTTFTTAHGLGNHSVMALHVDRDDNIWIGTSNGLAIYDAGEETFRHYGTEDGLMHGVVRAIRQSSSGKIWIGSHGGLQQFEDGRFVDVVLQEVASRNLAGLIPDFVYAIYEDREANIWVGTNFGLNQLSEHKFKTFSREEGLPHELTTSVYEDRDGDVWIGTWGGGLARQRDGDVKYWTAGDGLSSDHILGIHQDSEGNLWVGSDGDGLNLFQKDGTFRHYRVPVPRGRDARAPNTIRLIFEDSRKNLWIGTNRGLFHFVNGEFRDLSFLVDGAMDMVKTVVEDPHRVIWIGSRQGLTRVEGDHTVSYGEKDGIPGLPVNAILPDKDGLWFSTDAGGLNRFENGRVTAWLTEPAQVLRERVLHILDDGEGFLWMSNRNGIFRVSARELANAAAGRSNALTAVSYGRAEGMRRAQCNGIAQPSGWRDRQGKLWFPTMNGAVAFDPVKTPINALPPNLIVERVLANGEAVDFSKGARARTGARNLQFQYTAPSLRVPEKVIFRYKLEGFDSDWQEAGGARTASYNNLRPGDYTFHVIAANNDGVWNETGASLALTLPRHFHETFWFYGLCAIGLVSTGAGIFRLRVRRMHERERKLTALVDERTQKLKTEVNDRKEAEQRTAVFSRLGQQLSLTSTVKEAAEVIFEAADRLLGWDAGCLYAFDSEQEEGELILGYDIIDGRRQPYLPGIEGKKLSPLAKGSLGAGGKIVLRQDPVLEAEGYNPFGDQSRPSASLMHVPVRKGTATVGMLSIQSYTINAYSKKNLATLQSLADYCAGALERIRAENALHESRQMVLRQERLAVVGQLSAGIAHEFNNILTIVQGHTSLVLDEPSLSEDVIEMLREVSMGADRAAELTRQLLAFSRKQSMQQTWMDLNAAIKKLTGVLGRLLGENITIECRLEDGIPQLRADAGMMEQIIMNLAVNARDAMPDGGRLTVSTRAMKIARGRPHPEARPGKFVCLEVADTGTGMDEATVGRIFEPFFSTKDVGKGTGLGLASVYGIVKQHKGWIEVASKCGSGSSFRVFLPLDDPGADPAKEDRAAQPVAGGLETILVVEDEPSVRNLMRTVLHRQGYRVIEASNGEEALALWAKHREEIDLLLTDMIMPGGISGGDLSDRILAQNPNLAVIHTTGYTPDSLGAGQLFRKGITVLPKPHSPQDLARVVRECLDSKKPPARTGQA